MDRLSAHRLEDADELVTEEQDWEDGGYTALYVIGLDESWRRSREEEEEDYDRYQLIALDAQTSEIRWTCPLAELGFGDHYCGVTVANGLVYLSQGENRCAIDLETHQLCWRHQPAPPPSKLEHSSSVLADGLWYECREDGMLLVLDALTGEERWRYSLDGAIRQSCLVDDGSVYVIAGTTLYALH
ncbi:MAG TPA: PQQ-binding-like beta-propeller repeat protein [Ktedonobacteraceae bacterium]